MNKKFLILFVVFGAMLLLPFTQTYALTTTTATAAATKSAAVTLPAVPSFTVTLSKNSAVLRWGKATTKFTFTGYSLFRSEKSGVIGQNISQIGKTTLTFTDKTVKTGHTYYYSVRYIRSGTKIITGKQVKLAVPKIVVKSTPTASPTTTKPITYSLPDTAPQTPTPTVTATPSATITPPPANSQSPNIFSNPNPTAPTITDSHASAKDTARITTLYQLQSALQQYFADQGGYPLGNNVTLGNGQFTCLNSDGWKNSLDCPYPYFTTIPPDPGSSAYLYTALNGSYTVTATLDGTINGLSGKIMLTPTGITKSP